MLSLSLLHMVRSFVPSISGGQTAVETCGSVPLHTHASGGIHASWPHTGDTTTTNKQTKCDKQQQTNKEVNAHPGPSTPNHPQQFMGMMLSSRY